MLAVSFIFEKVYKAITIYYSCEFRQLNDESLCEFGNLFPSSKHVLVGFKEN